MNSFKHVYKCSKIQLLTAIVSVLTVMFIKSHDMRKHRSPQTKAFMAADIRLICLALNLSIDYIQSVGRSRVFRLVFSRAGSLKMSCDQHSCRSDKTESAVDCLGMRR